MLDLISIYNICSLEASVKVLQLNSKNKKQQQKKKQKETKTTRLKMSKGFEQVSL